MKYEDIYNLAKRFSPPKVDLRKAQILDDYGDDSFAKMPVSHNCPDDVTREEFEGIKDQGGGVGQLDFRINMECRWR